MNRKIIDLLASASIPVAMAILATYIYSVTSLNNVAEVNSHVVTSLLSSHFAPFQEQYPLISIAIAVTFFVIGAMLNVMTATRYNLFGTDSQLPLLLYVCFVVGFCTTTDIITPSIIACLGALSLRDLFRTYDNNGRTSKLLSGSFWIGVLPLIYPATIMLWIAPFIFLILFVKSLREIGVVVTGLLLPLALYAYVFWILGGEFLAPIVELFRSVIEHSSYPPTFNRLIWIAHIVLTSVVAALSFISLLQVERMSLRFVARTRLYCTFILVILGAFMALLPSHSYQVFAALAAPLSIVVTPALMRLRSWISVPLYFVIVLLSISILLEIVMA